ncbi:hypothetical protein T4E_4125 [Trichinella pseudospiralis]|uniref:Uncharacterized protein n=1 Tax=Trichinella pseudospiralis TaxID=6337 RepID=A0A0V0YNG2_TRIPS|nr:hypothetical protein T4E_4125 [Trichinella pseudospiralis]
MTDSDRRPRAIVVVVVVILHDDLRRPDPNPKLVWDHFLSVSETTAALRPEKTTVAAVGSGALVVQHNVSQSVTSPMHPFQTTHSLALSQQTQTDRHCHVIFFVLFNRKSNRNGEK